MKIKQLYDDYDVPYVTEESGHKHSRPGWINTECPYCSGNPGYHLGYNLDDNYFYCWRCNWHPIKLTIQKILNIDEREASKLLTQYGGRVKGMRKRHEIEAKPFSFPTGCGPLQRIHKQYLLSRGFNPDKLEHEWNLYGTGPISNLDKSSYKLRIIAPVYWNGEPVSFQGRDITNRQKLKYKACSKEREVIHHKDILYGKMEAWKKTAVVVEGITDVWRFGPVAIGTFGIEFTHYQIRIIARTFEKVFIAFDPDPQAIIQAKKLKIAIQDYLRAPEVEILKLKQDPGSMSQEEADYLIKNLIK